MRIIELCGKPGVGKSTLVECIKKNMHESVTILYRENILKESRSQRRWEELCFYIQYFLFPIGIVKQIKESISGLQSVNIKYVYRLYSLYSGLKRNKNRDIVVLLEEGPLQYISSLAHVEQIEENTIWKKIVELFSDLNLSFVLCECQDEECAKRIYNRKKDGDRFWDSDLSMIVYKIKIKDENIKILLKLFRREIFKIDMESNIEENSLQIIKIIEER